MYLVSSLVDRGMSTKKKKSFEVVAVEVVRGDDETDVGPMRFSEDPVSGRERRRLQAPVLPLEVSHFRFTTSGCHVSLSKWKTRHSGS